MTIWLKPCPIDPLHASINIDGDRVSGSVWAHAEWRRQRERSKRSMSDLDQQQRRARAATLSRYRRVAAAKEHRQREGLGWYGGPNMGL